MKTRTLAIERTGDFFRGKVTPKIRVAGQWLERAGFKPSCGSHPGATWHADAPLPDATGCH